MAHINLLPWREELRKQKQHQFVVVAAGTAVLGGQLSALGAGINAEVRIGLREVNGNVYASGRASAEYWLAWYWSHHDLGTLHFYPGSVPAANSYTCGTDGLYWIKDTSYSDAQIYKKVYSV